MDLIIPKQHFEQEIQNYFYQLGFEKIDEGYQFVREAQQQGMNYIYNNQRIQSPPKTIQIKYKVTFVGDGELTDIGGNVEREFTQIRFETFVDNELQGILEDCMYWDEPEKVLTYIKQLFKI